MPLNEKCRAREKTRKRSEATAKGRNIDLDVKEYCNFIEKAKKCVPFWLLKPNKRVARVS